MIEAKDAKDRSCNFCGCRNGVKEITFCMGNIGTTIAACRTCREKLREELERTLKE